MKTKFVILFTMLLISACSSSLQVPEVTTTPSPTRKITPSLESTSAVAIAPTPTDIQLPYNQVQESSEYCQSPTLKGYQKTKFRGRWLEYGWSDTKPPRHILTVGSMIIELTLFIRIQRERLFHFNPREIL